MAKKTIDEFIEQDLHGAVDEWMVKYMGLIPVDRVTQMRYALRELIAKGAHLYQKFEEEDKYCTRSIIL